MKKLAISLFLLCFTVIQAQTELTELTIEPSKNEIRLNALYMVLGSFEISYERLLNEDSGIGITVSVPFDKDTWDLNYAFTGYYRHYFGKRYAQGFFAEGFAMLNNTQFYITEDWLNWSWTKRNYTDLALGFGIGGKWISKRGVMLETNIGIGRQLFNANKTGEEIIGRIAVAVGYRF
jgi:hypothetical protein